MANCADTSLRSARAIPASSAASVSIVARTERGQRIACWSRGRRRPDRPRTPTRPRRRTTADATPTSNNRWRSARRSGSASSAVTSATVAALHAAAPRADGVAMRHAVGHRDAIFDIAPNCSAQLVRSIRAIRGRRASASRFFAAPISKAWLVVIVGHVPFARLTPGAIVNSEIVNGGARRRRRVPVRSHARFRCAATGRRDWWGWNKAL